MGERVFVRTSPVQPIDPEDAGPRIDYAKSDVNPTFPTARKALAWLHYITDAVWQLYRPLAAGLLNELGGARQIAFAFGMVCALGGLGACLAQDALPVFLMCLGGLIMGLMIPLRPRPPRGE